ncbi:MAG: TIM44-like domain-containing protein [Rhodospirillales bacterium]|nr:TIM44-like domain-containing protein [Rhodospirillales bacterium]
MTTKMRSVLRRSSFSIAAVAALTLALAPSLAEARAGRGGSFGSRGGMTYSAPPPTRTAPTGAQPMQRSMTQPGTTAGAPGYAGAPVAQPRSPFMSGLMGGLIGAGIGGLLLGHGFWGGCLGFGGFLGFLLQIFLLVIAVRFLIRLFTRNQQPAMAGGPGMFGRMGGGLMPNGRAPMGGSAAPSGPAQVTVGPSDYQAFEQLLQAVQAAWSAHDLRALQGMATPEMVSYFAEQLSEQASRGVRNEVTDVRLLSGDLAQAWTEQGREYATVAMRFSMVDVTRDGAGRVVDGNPNEHVTATEIWTFVRTRGGQWILSAIQQAR